MSSSILKRVEALEQRMDNLLNPPQPAGVFFEGDTEGIAAYQAQYPGRRIVRFVTVCARHCDDTCPHPGGTGCRKKLDGIPEGWQPREGTSCD